jgi:hypothetical protein
MTRDENLQVNKLSSTIQELRIQVQAAAQQQSAKAPIVVLGDPGKRVEVGQLPHIPKDLLDL